MKEVTKLVLPVAGLGKRLRPLTLKTPKNLVKVCGRPLIEYVLEEIRETRIKEVVLITNPKQREQFKRYVRGIQKGRFDWLKFHICTQPILGGDGHALLQAYDILKNEPFAVRFCDDIVVSDPPVLNSLLDIFSLIKAPVTLLQRVSDKLVPRFGVVKVKRVKFSGVRNLYKIVDVVEKPPLREAPSNLTIVGGYVITPKVLMNLKRIAGTLPLITDDALRIATALEIELIAGGRVYGWEFFGTRLDCGTLENIAKTEEFLENME
ncbi:MAG: sugar phosphate nucleotidyltransferase [Patescibacteria group bacterium]